MKEALFVKRNAKKWENYEKLGKVSADNLAEKFIELTDDLSYSKTFYPNSNTTNYLNGLTSAFHQSIYKNKKENKSRFITFWKTELPILFYQSRKQFLYSFLFLLVFSHSMVIRRTTQRLVLFGFTQKDQFIIVGFTRIIIRRIFNTKQNSMFFSNFVKKKFL